MTAGRGHLRRKGRAWHLLIWCGGGPGSRKRLRSQLLGTLEEIPSRAAARAAADRLLAARGDRQLHAGRVVTWQQWCRIYTERHLVLLAAGTRSSRASMLKRHLLPAFTGRALHTITPADVQQFVVDQHVAGAAASTVRARFALLRRVLRAAQAAELAVTPPRADRTDFPRSLMVPSSVKAKAFSPEECERIFRAAGDPLGPACHLARYAGLRCSEVLGLTWSAIDLAQGTLEVRQQALNGEIRPLKSKASAATLPLSPALHAALTAYRTRWLDLQPYTGLDLLFQTATGRPLDSATVRHDLHQLLDQLGIPKRGMHGFRHACALAMAAKGTNPEAIRRAMRHASLRVTAVYLSVSSEDVAAALRDSATVVRTLYAETPAGREIPQKSRETLISERTTETPVPPVDPPCRSPR